MMEIQFELQATQISQGGFKVDWLTSFTAGMPSTSAVAALLGASLALLPYGSTKDATFARLRRRRQPLERLRKEMFFFCVWVCATFFSAATPLEICPNYRLYLNLG